MSAAAFCAATHAALQTGSGAGSGADGAAGGADVVIKFEAADGKEVAASFVAVTVNVYGVDAFKPETVIGEELPDAVTPLGDDVTVYLVIAIPPVFVGAVKLTDAVVAPVAVAETAVGAPGAVPAVTETDAVPCPVGLEAEFTARI